MKVNNLVRLIKTGDALLDVAEGIIVGFHGKDFSIVKFTNGIPEGYNPVICIIDSCIEVI